MDAWSSESHLKFWWIPNLLSVTLDSCLPLPGQYHGSGPRIGIKDKESRIRLNLAVRSKLTCSCYIPFCFNYRFECSPNNIFSLTPFLTAVHIFVNPLGTELQVQSYSCMLRICFSQNVIVNGGWNAWIYVCSELDFSLNSPTIVLGEYTLNTFGASSSLNPVKVVSRKNFMKWILNRLASNKATLVQIYAHRLTFTTNGWPL